VGWILEVPQPLLDQAPEDLFQFARDQAAHQLATGEGARYQTALSRMLAPLDEELAASITANASQILDQLRPEFDRAAAVMRRCVELGIEPEATFESLFQSAGEVRTVWLSAHRHAAKLDDILLTRQQLSRIAGVPPAARMEGPETTETPSGVNWSITVTRPGSGAQLTERNNQAPWARWIRIAPDLQLVDPAEMEASEVRAATPKRRTAS
jgi:hypothetical protein